MKLIPSFPRQIAFPERKLVSSEKEFWELVQAYNGKKNLYYSIYSPENNNFNSTVIDKIFFDFDGEKALKDTQTLCNYLIKENTKFCVFFSGKKGFHVYTFCKETKDRNLLRNAHHYYAKKLGIKNDVHIIGDTARIARIPNTLHLTGNKYCISLELKELNKSLLEIHKLAENPRIKLFIYGSELLNLELLPKMNGYQNNENVHDIELKTIDITDEKETKLLSNMPPCVLSWLKDKNYSNHRNRFFFAQACAHAGLSPEETNYLAKKYYSQQQETNGNRNRYQEFRAERALEYAYSNKGFIISNCDKLISNNCCPKKCNKYNNKVFPLYQ